MNLRDYLIFFRWKNVLMIILTLVLIKFFLFEKFELLVTLDTGHAILLILSVVFVAMAGYIINDVNDVEADLVNKPDRVFVKKKISRTWAYNLFIVFNSLGLLTGMYLSYHVGHTSYFIIYVLASLLLYQYAKELKKRYITGNLLVALVVFLSIILPLVFDVLPATNSYNRASQLVVFRLLIIFAVFSFFMTLLREIVKDFEDQEGDRKIGARSFPIVLGEKRTKTLLIFISAPLIAGIYYFSYLLFEVEMRAGIYLAVCVGLPLIYFVYSLRKANGKREFHRLSGLLKLIMLLGTLTLVLI